MPTKITRSSNVIIVDQNNLPELLAALPLIENAAVDVGADVFKALVHRTFERQGDPADWPPNSAVTQAWKGHNTVMEGRTGTLKDGVEVRRSFEAYTPDPLQPTRFIGWFDDPHPDSHTGLTKGEVAMTHEFGLPFGENLPKGGAGSDPAFGMGLSSLEIDIPPRPWLSTTADAHGKEVLTAVEAVLMERIAGVLKL